VRHEKRGPADDRWGRARSTAAPGGRIAGAECLRSCAAGGGDWRLWGRGCCRRAGGYSERRM